MRRQARRGRGRGWDRPGDGPAEHPAPALVATRRTEAPLSTAEWAVRLGMVVARNAVGLVGLLFFGWSAASLTVLYFVDTLAGMGAVFAAVGFKLSHADPRRGLWTLAEGVLTALAVAGFLVAAWRSRSACPWSSCWGPAAHGGRYSPTRRSWAGSG